MAFSTARPDEPAPITATSTGRRLRDASAEVPFTNILIVCYYIPVVCQEILRLEEERVILRYWRGWRPENADAMTAESES
jgi:hypothetical protein